MQSKSFYLDKVHAKSFFLQKYFFNKILDNTKTPKFYSA